MALKYAGDRKMTALRVEQHPDKTFIDRIGQGFDFWGYWFDANGLSVAAKTIDRMREKASRLYEQGIDEVDVGRYLRRWVRWVRWVRSGVEGLVEVVEVGLRFSVEPMANRCG